MPRFASPASYWIDTAPAPSFPRLEGDMRVDVAIVGGGITGITAATLLKRAGKKVALLEAQHVAVGVTGHTTAHLTEAIDARYATLISDFGVDGARLAAQASRAAIEHIATTVRERGIRCDFQRLPGYLYAERESDLSTLHAEYEAAKRVGLAVDMTRDVPLPFSATAAVRFEDQAQFHPREYLLPLARAIPGDGSHVFEQTRAIEIAHDVPCRVATERGVILADQVIEATHAPLNRVFLQTKIAHYRSYVLAVRARNAKLHGLFWDTDDPYHYLRTATTEGGHEVLIVGGEDHKTGAEEDTIERYERLAAYTRARFDVEAIEHRWSAQVIEPVDGLPFVGKNSLSSRVFVATGYSGNGITFGTMAGILLADQILGRPNPWGELFDATRVKPLASAKDYVMENVDFPLHLVTDRFRATASSPREVKPGEGKIVRVAGERLAVFRGDDGALHAFSSVCPHLGCQVRFNNAERTWDCPCHGSRYACETGEVINGPAKCGLSARRVADDEEAKRSTAGAE